jgi:hypothetical protein
LLLFRRRRGALLAAAVYEVFLPIAQHTAVVTPDIWAVDFTIATVATYLEAVRSTQHRLRWLLLCGVIVGVGMYFRPNQLICRPRLRSPARADTIGGSTCAMPRAIIAVAVLVVSPWTAINYAHFHRFIPTRMALV